MKLYNTKTKYSTEALDFVIDHIVNKQSIDGVSLRNINREEKYIDILFSMSYFNEGLKNTFMRSMYDLERELDRKLTLTCDNMYVLYTSKIIYGIRIDI